MAMSRYSAGQSHTDSGFCLCCCAAVLLCCRAVAQVRSPRTRATPIDDSDLDARNVN